MKKVVIAVLLSGAAVVWFVSQRSSEEHIPDEQFDILDRLLQSPKTELVREQRDELKHLQKCDLCQSSLIKLRLALLPLHARRTWDAEDVLVTQIEQALEMS